MAETRRLGDRRRRRVRHVADQGQDTRVHAERGTATDDRDVHHGGGGGGGDGGHGGQHSAGDKQR